jgi:hypothetical protein
MTLNLDTIKEELVYRIKPETIRGLKTFLTDQGVNLPQHIRELIKDTDTFCEAFYYSKYGPLLMMFELRFNAKEGQEEDRKQAKRCLIENLTGDKDLGELFDLHRASVRVFRCSKAKGSFETLEKYVAEL